MKTENTIVNIDEHSKNIMEDIASRIENGIKDIRIRLDELHKTQFQRTLERENKLSLEILNFENKLADKSGIIDSLNDKIQKLTINLEELSNETNLLKKELLKNNKKLNIIIDWINLPISKKIRKPKRSVEND